MMKIANEHANKPKEDEEKWSLNRKIKKNKKVMVLS